MNFILTFLMNGLFGMYATKLPDPAKYTIFGLSVAIICISAYLLGSINFAIIISKKQYNQDIRSEERRVGKEC